MTVVCGLDMEECTALECVQSIDCPECMRCTHCCLCVVYGSGTADSAIEEKAQVAKALLVPLPEEDDGYDPDYGF